MASRAMHEGFTKTRAARRTTIVSGTETTPRPTYSQLRPAKAKALHDTRIRIRHQTKELEHDEHNRYRGDSPARHEPIEEDGSRATGG